MSIKLDRENEEVGKRKDVNNRVLGMKVEGEKIKELNHN